MRNLFFILPLLILTAFAALLIATNTGCQKSNDNSIDTIATPPIPPPPAPDTISFIKKIEESYLTANPVLESRTRDYNFYYDSQKRLVTVGIKNYGPVLADSLTTRFFYAGSSSSPYMIIQANVQNSSIGGPVYYDTCWITYGANNLPVKDSSTDYTYNFVTNTLEHKIPLLRYYTIIDSRTLSTNWLASVGSETQPQLIRRDTVWTDANGMLQDMKAQFYNGLNFPGSYTRVEGINRSGFINPLSKLNISGTPYSLLYTPVKQEILGSRFHFAVFNSNPLPYYLDFCSKWLPRSFFLISYNRFGIGIGSGGINFNTEITPWTLRPSYPSEMKVSCSFSFPGDQFKYRYYYY